MKNYSNFIIWLWYIILVFSPFSKCQYSSIVLNIVYSYSTATITKYNIQGGLNNRNLFLYMSRGEKSRSRCEQDWIQRLSLWLEDCSFLTMCSYVLFFLCKHLSAISLSSYKDTSPIESGMAPPLWPYVTSIISLMALSPNTVTLWIRAQHRNFEGHSSSHNTLM